jgi:hypothetical protein
MPDGQQELIEELTRERDRALEQIEKLTCQLDRAHQERELAQRGVQSREAGHDYPSPCSICRKRIPEAKGMIEVPLRRFPVFFCNGCIDEMHQRSNEIIARKVAGYDAPPAAPAARVSESAPRSRRLGERG